MIKNSLFVKKTLFMCLIICEDVKHLPGPEHMELFSNILQTLEL